MKGAFMDITTKIMMLMLGMVTLGVYSWNSTKIAEKKKIKKTDQLTKNVKLIIFVPTSHADSIRQELGKSGAGKIGNYDFCSFSSQGIGRFRGNSQSNPAVGIPGIYESVEEERIEVIVPRDILKEVIACVRAVHPYEEVPFDIWALEDLGEFL